MTDMIVSIATGFNPRAPWGARRLSSGGNRGISEFQSTRPLGGATCCACCLERCISVSIHAPPGGRDFTTELTGRRQFKFQSTRPLGGATFYSFAFLCPELVSIHAPPGGRDVASLQTKHPFAKFQSTRPLGGATKYQAE